MKIDCNNYMVYVGPYGREYIKYRELCREYGLQFYGDWTGNVEYYGMIRGEPRALNIGVIEEYPNIPKMTLEIFESNLVRSENSIDNFSII